MLRTILAAVLAIAFSVGVQASAQAQSPDAKQLAEFVSPTKDAQAVDLEVEGLKAWLLLNIRFSGRGPTFDETLLDSSFVEAVRSEDADYRSALIAALEAGDASRREEALKFFRSADGQQMLADQRRHDDQVRAWLNAPKDKREAEPPRYVPSDAEKAFATSDTVETLGKAVADARKKVEQLPTAMERAASIYCAKNACQNGELEMFHRMYASAHMSSARGEHAMWGQTAADIFPDMRQAALARAACDDDGDQVRLLVADGADPNAVGGDGVMGGGYTYRITPLFWALDCGAVTGVEALLKAGADPNIRVGGGRNAVMFAAADKNPAFLRAMLDSGGDPNAHDDRDTALIIAWQQQSGLRWVDKLPEDRVRANWDALLAAGADVNFAVGDPSLANDVASEAALFNDWPIVLELLNRGYSRDIADVANSVQQVDIHPDSTRQAAKKQVIAALRSRGFLFPFGLMNNEIEPAIEWIDYRVQGGALDRAEFVSAFLVAETSHFPREVRPPFNGERFQLWYLADKQVFVEAAKSLQTFNEVKLAEVAVRWGLQNEQIAAVRADPQAWKSLYLSR